jgi:hypothetical protein
MSKKQFITKGWDTPKEVTRLDVAFGCDIIGRLLPLMEEIPEKYKCYYHPTVKLISKWFFGGLPKGTEFIPKEGIDKDKALLQIKACMSSFDPQHEHKEAGCAYLLDLFFEEVKLPK